MNKFCVSLKFYKKILHMLDIPSELYVPIKWTSNPVLFPIWLSACFLCIYLFLLLFYLQLEPQLHQFWDILSKNITSIYNNYVTFKLTQKLLEVFYTSLPTICVPNLPSVINILDSCFKLYRLALQFLFEWTLSTALKGHISKVSRILASSEGPSSPLSIIFLSSVRFLLVMTMI